MALANPDGLLPAFRFRDNQDNEHDEKRRRGRDEHHPPPGFGSNVVQAGGQSDQEEADIGRGAHHACQHWAPFFRPAFHYQRHP